jgi:hypothetical protein
MMYLKNTWYEYSVYVVILTLRSSPFTAFHNPTIHSDEPILCLKNKEYRCMTFKYQ